MPDVVVDPSTIVEPLTAHTVFVPLGPDGVSIAWLNVTTILTPVSSRPAVPPFESATAVDPELSGAIASAGTASSTTPLTRREREVLGRLADGMTNERVGKLLGVSAETVQSHVRNAMGKLDADTRAQALAEAIRRFLIG